MLWCPRRHHMPLRHMQLHTTQILTGYRAVPRYWCPVPGQARNGWGEPSSRSDGTPSRAWGFSRSSISRRRSAIRRRPGGLLGLVRWGMAHCRLHMLAELIGRHDPGRWVPGRVKHALAGVAEARLGGECGRTGHSVPSPACVPGLRSRCAAAERTAAPETGGPPCTPPGGRTGPEPGPAGRMASRPRG